MNTRWTVAIAATMTLATAVTSCAAKSPESPAMNPVSPSSTVEPVSSSVAAGVGTSAGGAALASLGSSPGTAADTGYIHISSLQDLLARTDAAEAPTGAQPTLDQLKQLVPGKLTAQDASQFLLKVPANMIQLPSGAGGVSTQPSDLAASDLSSSQNRASSWHGGGRGGPRPGGGAYAVDPALQAMTGGNMGPASGGAGGGNGGGPMGPGPGPGGPMGPGPGPGGPMGPGPGPGGPGPGWGHHQGWHGQGWNNQGWNNQGWGYGGSGYDGGGFVPFGGWNNSFFNGFNGCGCGYLPFGVLGGALPIQGGLFPFEFYPTMFNQYLYLTPYSIASGLWYPFFPPFYLSAGTLLPYPGFSTPLAPPISPYLGGQAGFLPPGPPLQ